LMHPLHACVKNLFHGNGRHILPDFPV